jgi:hypothetical protein
VIPRSLVIFAALAAVVALPASARAALAPCCAPPAKLPALHATGLQVVQGVQSSGAATGKYRGVKLVAHRRTVVRLAAKADGNAPLVGAALYGSRAGRPLPGSPLSADQGLQDPGKGYTFTLPDGWTGGTIALRGQLVPAAAVLGACADCAARMTGVHFASTGSERVEAIRLTAAGWPAAPAPRAALAPAQALEPLADGAFQFDAAWYAATLDVSAIAAAPLSAEAKSALALAQVVDATLPAQTCKDIGTPSPCPDQVVAIGALDPLTLGSLSGSGLPTSVTGASAAARALGRGLGPAGASGCGNLAGTGLAAAPFSLAGWSDYLGGCAGNTWVSAKGWDDAVAALRAHAAGKPAAVTPAAGLRVVAVAVGGGAPLLVSARPAVAIAPRDKSGYTAVVRSRTGRVLGRATLRAGRAGGVVVLDGIVPLRGASATRLPSAATDLTISRGGTQVLERTRSAHAPTVKLTQQPKRGSVRWKAADADHDALQAGVDYSADGGRSFRTVWSGASTGKATLPAGALGRADKALVRVRVSDGFDQATAVSKPFSVAGRAPTVTMDVPATLPASAPLRLAGSATDDGFAPVANLRWTIDGKTAATGARATVDGLAPGRHTVRLVATDRAGRHASAHARVTVAPVTPQPLSIAAPAKLDAKASSVTLTVAAATACKLTVAGAGATTTTAKLTRAPSQVAVPVKPGTTALKLTLTFRSGRYGTRDAVSISRS